MNLTANTTTWRVLIVDDESDNLNLAADVLSFSGATIKKADTGQQALDVVDEFLPNVILLDLAMPGIDGWELHQRLRARPDFDQVPIIALTALVMPEDAMRVAEAGFDGYITKPFRVKRMLEDLTMCVETFSNSKGMTTKDGNHD